MSAARTPTPSTWPSGPRLLAVDPEVGLEAVRAALSAIAKAAAAAVLLDHKLTGRRLHSALSQARLASAKSCRPGIIDLWGRRRMQE